MFKAKHSKSFASIGVHATDNTIGVQLADVFRNVLQFLSGSHAAHASRRPSAVPSPARAAKEEDLPQEISCLNEREATDLAASLRARGHAAEAHYDIYDYSWSVQISHGIR